MDDIISATIIELCIVLTISLIAIIFWRVKKREDKKEDHWK